MKTYTSHSDSEAQGLREGKISLLVIPMNPKPYTVPEFPGLWFFNGPTGYRSSWNKNNPYPPDCLAESCPYASGDEIGVKEAWMQCIDPDKSAPLNLTFIYRATDEPARWMNGSTDRWRPASKMPTRAICTRLLCRSVEARRVQSMTALEVFRWLPELASSQDTIESPTLEIKAAWHRRRPGLPWETAWAWMVTVERKEP